MIIPWRCLLSVFTKKRIRRMLVKLNKDLKRQRALLRLSCTRTCKKSVNLVPLVSFSVLHICASDAPQLRKVPHTGLRTDLEAGQPPWWLQDSVSQCHTCPVCCSTPLALRRSFFGKWSTSGWRGTPWTWPRLQCISSFLSQKLFPGNRRKTLNCNRFHRKGCIKDPLLWLAAINYL